MENAGSNIRGLLTRWLLELKPGCFVGNVTATVREQIWEGILIDNRSYHTGAVMVYSTDNEQGFDIRMINNPRRCVVDFEGIKLITYQGLSEEECNSLSKDTIVVPSDNP